MPHLPNCQIHLNMVHSWPHCYTGTHAQDDLQHAEVHRGCAGMGQIRRTAPRACGPLFLWSDKRSRTQTYKLMCTHTSSTYVSLIKGWVCIMSCKQSFQDQRCQLVKIGFWQGLGVACSALSLSMASPVLAARGLAASASRPEDG